MNTNQLIPVFAGEMAGASIQLVDARLLHGFLDSLQEFANWIKNRIADYGFTEGQDYLTVLSNRADGKAGRGRTDYHLTIDMAKELSMVERNEKGKQARRYFIDMERRALAQLSTNPCQLPEPPILTKAQQGELFALVANKARNSGKPNAYFWSRFQNHFKIASYKTLPADRFEEAFSYLKRLEGDNDDALISISAQAFKQLQAERDNFQRHFERLSDQAANTITINLNGGMRSMYLVFEKSVDERQRYLVDVTDRAATINNLEGGAFVTTSGNLAKLIADDGQLVTIQDLPAIIEAAAKRLNAAQRLAVKH